MSKATMKVFFAGAAFAALAETGGLKLQAGGGDAAAAEGDAGDSPAQRLAALRDNGDLSAVEYADAMRMLAAGISQADGDGDGVEDVDDGNDAIPRSVVSLSLMPAAMPAALSRRAASSFV